MDFQKTELFHPSRGKSISSDIVPFFFFFFIFLFFYFYFFKDLHHQDLALNVLKFWTEG